MIDALFGSKTRVKLLHLFLNNPGQSFYVREITRLIDEQINSVRRELSNMLEVGVITSDSSDNKLYYQVNQRYEYYAPLRAIFADLEVVAIAADEGHKEGVPSWQRALERTTGLRVAIMSGVLVPGSGSSVDLLLVGDLPKKQSASIVAAIEGEIGREISYSVISYNDFYYRLSVHDQFIGGITRNKHKVLVDVDNILKSK